MKYKKGIIIIMLAIFLFSITSVCASEIDTPIASEDTSQMELSQNSEFEHADNLQTDEGLMAQANDEERISINDIKTSHNMLGGGEGTYYDLRNEIGNGGNKNLAKSYYHYTGGDAIEIKNSGIINGNGAVIDMAGSSINAFKVSISGVTIKNLIIKNANVKGKGGAILFSDSGTLLNCNFINNRVNNIGGAVYFGGGGTVKDCNFDNNTANSGGAISMSSGSVTNCNFNNNLGLVDSGAIYMSSGNVENCNFTNNQAGGEGGAIYYFKEGNVKNCNFTANQATYGGAIYFLKGGNVENCNLAGNKGFFGSAIYLDSTDTLTISNSIFLNNRAISEDLEVIKNENNITITFTGGNNLLNAIYSSSDVSFKNVTYWGANGITNTNSYTPSRSNKEAGQNITVGIVINYNLVLNEVKVTDENGTIVLGISAGENYYISARHDSDSYYTKTETTISNMTVNVTSQTTTNRTVNITAKSSIYNEFMPGKLLFILPNSTEINAKYAGNGTWWAEHTFDDAGDYNINATYIGLDNVAINNANIRIMNIVPINTSDIRISFGDIANVIVYVPETINGQNITITVNKTSKNATVKNGEAKANFTNLPAGKHLITADYLGDDYNCANSTNATLTVSKRPTEISLKNKTIDLFVKSSIETGATLIPADAGNLTYTSSNSSVAIVENGKIKGIKQGKTNITVSFAGNENYTAAENKTIAVTVNLNDASITVNNETLNLKIGQNFTIIANTTPEGLNVTYVQDDSGVYIVDENGVVTALKNGTGSVLVKIGGDGVYAENSTIVNVTVSKVPTEIKVTNTTLDLKVDGEIETGATLIPADAGNLTYTVSNPSIVKVEEGKIIALKEGNATITVSFTGNKKYLPAENKTINVTVQKVNTNMDISAGEITEGENATISVTLPSDATGNVSTTVNGKTYSSEVKDGKAVITVPDLLKGDYTLPITYSGDDKYNPLTKDVNITVEGGKAIISAPELVKYYSGSERFTVNLTYAKGSPAANKPVNITINGVTYKRTTDDNGTASLNINLNSGKYDVTINADDVTAYSVVTVLSTINASDVESKTKSLVFTATFIDGEGNPLTDGTLVTFNVKGVVHNSTVKGGEGSASIDLTLDSGRYIITSFNPVSGENASNNIAVDLKDAEMILSGDEITVGENATISVTLPDDATGNVTASVNGKSYSSKVNDSKANIIIPGLSAGNHTIPVTYSGDDKYNSASGETNITVNKANATITIDAPAITVGENATVTVNLASDATGNVTIGNESVPVKEGTASAVLTDLPVGTNTIPVTYSGDDKYNPIETSVDVVVNDKPVPAKENLTIKATADEITEGENATVIITGLENATGNVSASVNGKTYTAPVNNGEAIITVPDLTENATATINYPGDDKYNPAMTTVNITVNKNTVTITAENLTKYYKDSEKFTVTVTDAKGQVAPNKTVDITINGVTYKRTTDDNGTASLNINLDAGEYPVSIAVDDVIVNSTVTVKSTIDASDVVKMFRNDTQYYARFTDSNGTALANTKVSFNINGIIYNRTTDANGTAKLNINMAAGDYIITATNPVTGEMKSNTIKVISLIESNDLTKYYRNTSQFVVRIHSADGGYAGAGEEVKFNINGVFYTRTTNATGHAKLNINLGQGNYTITTYHKDCSHGNEITVLPILSADDLVMKYRDGSQFKAKLVDGQGKAYAGQSIQFNIKGVFYTRTTGSDGTAKLNINLMAGEYIITSSYNGFNIANKITVRG